jgi:hypothetical protein
MKHPALAQQQFSSEHVNTVSHVFPTIEFLLTSLEAAERDKEFRPICDAIAASVANLSKWYRTLDTCHVYCYVSAGTFTRLGLCQLPYDKALVPRVLRLSYEE